MKEKNNTVKVLVGAVVIVALFALIFGERVDSEPDKVEAEVAQTEVTKATESSQEKADKEKKEKEKAEREKKEQEKAEEERKQKEEQEKIEAELKKLEEEEKEKDANLESYSSEISYDTLARNPYEVYGDRIKLNGTILQVINADYETQYRFAINDNYDEVIFLGIADKDLHTKILEDDNVTIYGKAAATITYTTTFNVEKEIPAVEVLHYEIN